MLIDSSILVLLTNVNIFRIVQVKKIDKLTWKVDIN